MNKALKKLRASVLTLDLYGEDIGFTANGQRSIKSVSGLVLSIGILTTVLAFGANKFLLCFDYQETKHH